MIATGSSPSSSRASASVFGPAVHTAGQPRKVRQFAVCFVAQRNKIIGLAPGGRFLGATGLHHLTDDSGQHSRRVLPANQIEALERLVDEVERVSSVGVCPFGAGREQSIGEHGGR